MANQWIAETSSVVEPSLRGRSPHSLPIESPLRAWCHGRGRSVEGDDLVGPPSELDHTVDYVLRSTGGTLDGIDGIGEVVGDELQDQTSTGWWPSDHAGVFVTVQIVKT